MDKKDLNNFIDSIKGFADLKKIDQIKWFVFYKIELKKYKIIDKEDIKPLFSSVWLEEPQNFNQLWSYLNKKKKVLIKKDKGFVLNRKVYENLQKSYSLLSGKSIPKKKLKRIDKNSIVTIPIEVIKLLPKDLVSHCEELNENLIAENWISSMLLMRKILPLSIIRKFQKDNKENEVKDSDGEYFASKKLLEETKNLVQPRTRRELKDVKFLFDSVQHIFTFHPRKPDISPCSMRLRVFLEELFYIS